MNRLTGIIFKESIFLPTSPELPPGFYIEDPIEKLCEKISNPPPDLLAQIGTRWIIKREFADMSDTFKALHDILESMEQLYEWALKLPDFKYLENI
jgi:hypothetical protein